VAGAAVAASPAAAAGAAKVWAISSGRPAARRRRPDPQRVLTMRRFARPWVMTTVPRTPSSGEPPRTS